MNPLPRLFFALALPDDLRAAVARPALPELGADGRPFRPRWSHPSGLHVTLAFLGSVDAARLGELLEVAGRVTADAQGPLSLNLGGLGAFPGETAARVLWRAVDGGAGLAGLAGQLAAALAAADFPFDQRPFVPHLTLARFDRPINLAGSLDAVPGASWQTMRFLLMESLSGPERQGAVGPYRPVAEFTMGGRRD